MKRIILALAVVCMVSCKHSHEEGHNHDGHDHKEGKHKEEEHGHDDHGHEGHDHKEGEHGHDDHGHEGHDHKDDGHGHDEHGHEEGDIHLTPEQLKSAKIQIGKMAKRTVREFIEVTGKIQAPPESKATVYSPLEAFVHQAKLLLGDKVKKGQTIAVLQHPNFTNLQYSYLEATNKLNVSKQEFKRKEMLFKNDIASKKSYQLAESEYRSAKNLVQSLSSQLKMAGLSPQQIQKNGIQQYVYVKAPISGYIVKSNLNQGKFLDANAEMMEIINNDHMHAELNVFSTDVNKLKKGDKFVFTPNGIDREYEGDIELISQGIDNDSKTINVHGHFKDEQRLLKVGTFLNAKILIGDGDLSNAVPKDAIIEFEGKKIIFKAESDNEFVPLEVTLGNAENGFVALKSIQDNNFNINFVVQGAHFLKGELLKGSGEMDGHGHAH